MLSNLFKILYTFTYISHFFLVLFIYQLFDSGKNIWQTNIIRWHQYILDVIWPLLVFLLLLFICHYIIKKSKKLPRTTATFKNGSQQKATPMMVSQLLPYISIILKFVNQQDVFALFSLIVLILLSLLLLINRGCYNVSLAILGYKQYRVNSESNSYLLVSKRRINNFNHTFNMVELNNEILLEV